MSAMTKIYRVAFITSLPFVLPWNPSQAASAASSSLPPLLRFAENFTENQRRMHPPPTRKPPVRHDDIAGKYAKRLAEQEIKIRALQDALNEVNVEEKRPDTVDLSALTNMVQSLRGLTGLTLSERQAAEKIATLTHKLDASNKQQQALKQQIDVLNRAGEQKSAASAAANEKQVALHQQLEKLQEETQSLQQQRQLDQEKLEQAQRELAQRQQQLSAGETRWSEAQKALEAAQMQQQQDAKVREESGNFREKSQLELEDLQKAREKDVEELNEARLKLVVLQNQLDIQLASQSSAVAAQTPANVSNEKTEVQDPQSGTKDAQGVWLAGVTPEDLKNESVRQGYAIGMSLGAEILLLQKSQQEAGNNVDKNLILYGIVDAFNHQPKLDEKTFRQSLDNADKISHDIKGIQENPPAKPPAPVAFKPTIRKEDRDFVDAYKKRKGVKKSTSGFWYEVIYTGKKAIKPDDIVSLVMEESLTNGTVINDMAKSKKVLTETMSRLPPLLQEALAKLKSEGEMSMVVPPELAYGKQGLPPKIPTNATMVYMLKIVNVSAAKK